MIQTHILFFLYSHTYTFPFLIKKISSYSKQTLLNKKLFPKCSPCIITTRNIFANRSKLIITAFLKSRLYSVFFTQQFLTLCSYIFLFYFVIHIVINVSLLFVYNVLFFGVLRIIMRSVPSFLFHHHYVFVL